MPERTTGQGPLSDVIGHGWGIAMSDRIDDGPASSRAGEMLPALVPSGGAIALPTARLEAAREYARASHARRTQAAYARAWTDFEAWCEKHRLPPLPAPPEAVAVWMSDLADGAGRAQALSRSSINQALSAVIFRHRDAGFPFDRKHKDIARTWRGIANTKARSETVRKAQPIMADELRRLLDKLRPDRAIDVRDAALLALGWAGALRRSELVALDWQRLGNGGGFVLVTDQGATITLMASKASQDQAETVVIPRADMPTACEALETWSARAGLKPGEPVFRSVDQRQIIAAERLTDRSVSRIIKARVRGHLKANGRNAAEAEELAALFSGHSLRAGYATSAAAKDMPGYRIRKHTRHKSAAVLEGYIRSAEQWTKGGLKGVGF
jgi:integrase